MKQLNAVITGIAASVPDYILTNEELSRMVDTSDEWIMSRVGIKERRILKGEQQGVSVLGTQAVKELLHKTRTSPAEIDAVILLPPRPITFSRHLHPWWPKIRGLKTLSVSIWKWPVPALSMVWRYVTG